LVKARREETAAALEVVEAAVPVPVPVPVVSVPAVPVEELTPETGVEEVTGSETAVEGSELVFVPVADPTVEADTELVIVAPIENEPV